MRISTKLADTKMKTEQWQPKAAMTNEARKKITHNYVYYSIRYYT